MKNGLGFGNEKIKNEKWKCNSSHFCCKTYIFGRKEKNWEQIVVFFTIFLDYHPFFFKFLQISFQNILHKKAIVLIPFLIIKLFKKKRLVF